MAAKSTSVARTAKLVRQSSGAVRIRKSIYSLTDQEVDDLRKAYEGLYKVSQQGGNDDERGFQWIAGVHGLPLPIYCQHGNLNFVTWHRAYLYEFELRLQDQVPSVMLPYWDWTSDQAIAKGIPPVLSAPTYKDPKTGQTRPNPLYSALCQVTGKNTVRSPKSPSRLQHLKDLVKTAQSQTIFAQYSPALENPHNGLHLWVGGNMGQINIAAYDPIFWLHHANIDRFWFKWQEANGYPPVPPSVENFVCAPFNYIGKQTLDARTEFKYVYADFEALLSPVAAAAAKKAPAQAVAFEIGHVRPDVGTAQLHFLNLRKTEESYQVHIFCDTEGRAYEAETSRDGNPNYATTLYLFGHEACAGGPGHCDYQAALRGPYDLRPPHHLEPYNTFVDVTRAVQHAAKAGKKRVVFSFVITDADDKPAKPSVVEYDGISLVTHTHPAPRSLAVAGAS